MNKTEFLAALSLRLADISAEERDEAVKYYSEYLDEVGPEGEAAAIAELGGAEKVANIIRANCGAGPLPFKTSPAPAKPSLTLDAPLFGKAPKAPPVAPAFAAAEAAASDEPQQNPAPDSRNAGHPYAETACGTQPPRYDVRNTRILWILLIVFTAPIWIGLVGGAFGLLAGAVAAIVGLIVSGFGVMVSAAVAFFGGIMLLGTNIGSAFATMGLSLMVFSLGAVLGAGAIWLVTKAVPLLFQLVGKTVQFITGKVRG